MTDKKKIKKNIAFESFDDIDLNKSADLEAGKDAVGMKQKPTEKAKTKPVAKKITKTTSSKKVAKKPLKPEELIRTTIDFPKSEHKRLKILAMEADMKLYQYLYQIVTDHLKKQK